jgi:hypothetical protein
MQRRRRIKYTISFEERLARHAARLHAAARRMPLGKERDEVLARALQAETATGINRWLNSAGLEQSGGQLRQHLNEMTQPSERRRDRDR